MTILGPIELAAKLQWEADEAAIGRSGITWEELAPGAKEGYLRDAREHWIEKIKREPDLDSEAGGGSPP